MMFDRSPKILALDDDATWLDQLPLVFENLGYDVHSFSNLDQGASGGLKRGHFHRRNGPMGTTYKRVFLSISHSKLNFQRAAFA